MRDLACRPISCSFYDELEARATLRQPCELRYRVPGAEAATHYGVITELFIREKVEFLRCHDNFELRLDYLTGVDGKEIQTYC